MIVQLKKYRGALVEIIGVVRRFGIPVAYKVRLEKKDKEFVGTAQDFYLDRCVVEDIQPPTATSVSLREGLSHWNSQRDYWHTQSAGLESLAFAVASVTPTAVAQFYEWGWDFAVPDPMRGEFTQVRCPAFQHGNFWTMTTAVYSIRGGLQPVAEPIEDHWARTFHWTYTIAKGMADQFGWPWQEAANNVKARAIATAKVLVPMVDKALKMCLEARFEITGVPFDLPPGSVSAGFSDVRVKAGKIGLTEPPTDRRPYTVISISPAAARDRHYLWQVVLHECVHVAVNSKDGPPHNGLFNKISDLVGLEPKHRD